MPDSLRGRIRAHAPLLVSVAFSTAWTVLALRSPTVTYHLAPALAAAAWPVTARVLRGRTTLGGASRAAAGGFAVAVATTAELTALDVLRGPVLVGGDATTEAALFAALGALWGLRTLTKRAPGLVVRAFTDRPA